MRWWRRRRKGLRLAGSQGVAAVPAPAPAPAPPSPHQDDYGGCLAGVSDSVAQKLSGYHKIEKRLLLLKMIFGFAYCGPFGHFLHEVLDYIFKGKKDTKTVAKKVLLEQITSSPWNNLLFLFYYGDVVERRPFKEVKTRVKKQYPSVQLSAWMGGYFSTYAQGLCL